MDKNISTSKGIDGKSLWALEKGYGYNLSYAC